MKDFSSVTFSFCSYLNFSSIEILFYKLFIIIMLSDSIEISLLTGNNIIYIK